MSEPSSAPAPAPAPVSALPDIPPLPPGAPTLARHLARWLEYARNTCQCPIGDADEAAYAEAVAVLAALPIAERQSADIGGAVHWRDEDGRWVPESLIHIAKQLEDDVVRTIATAALCLSESLSRFKSLSFAEAQALLGQLAADHGVILGGKRGDVYLYSFDRGLRVSVTSQDRVTFGPTIEIAKQLLNEWLQEEEASAELKAIVASAFALDEQKRLRVSEILRLRRYQVGHPKWVQAMAVIAQSMEPMGKREYLRCHIRDKSGVYTMVPLDLSAVKVSEIAA